MSVASPSVEFVRIRPVAGCGTLQSPWSGWETQVEDGGAERLFSFDAGIYLVSRPLRLPSGATLEARNAPDDRAWFLPPPSGDRLEALFLVDGASQVAIRGISFNGGGDRARFGLLARAGRGLEIDGCRFGDFGARDGAALGIEGESAERSVREVVIRGGRFVNAVRGMRLGAHTADLLVTDNHFEEIGGSSVLIDPGDRWSDYGLIFVKNRLRATKPDREEAFVRILPGAEGIRLAENTIEGSASGPGPVQRAPRESEATAGVEIRGGGALSTRRLEVLLNRILGTTGPGIAAAECGPGLLAAGNHLVACGSGMRGALDLVGCHGVLVEDNEIAEAPGPGVRFEDCSVSRLNGNEVTGESDLPGRGGTVGVLVAGPGSRRIRVTDNRVSGVREEGVRVSASRGVRLVGNEVRDCGEGIHVEEASNLLLVGNDCRDNGRAGIRVDASVRRGLVALNYAILNGAPDLEVLGSRMRCHSNKVDQPGSVPETA